MGWNNQCTLGSSITILIRCIPLFEIYLQNNLSLSGKKFLLMNLMTTMEFVLALWWATRASPVKHGLGDEGIALLPW